MSYPIHSLRGGGNARAIRTQSGFWGLDAISGDFDRDPACSKEAQNLIWQGEALKVRSGYRQLCKLDGRINGIWFYQDMPLVHAGNNLYRLNTQWKDPVLLYKAMADAPSMGVIRNQTVIKRICAGPLMDGWRRETVTRDFLFINDSKNFLIYDGETVRSVMDPYWGESVRRITDGGVEVEYYATVPFASVAKRPDSAMADVDPRGDNRLTQFRCDSFYVDSSAAVTDFVLTCRYEDYNDDVPPEMQIRCDDGLWHNISLVTNNSYLRTGEYGRLIVPAVKAGQEVSIDIVEGRITNLGNGTNYVANDGMDNVRLTYAIYKEPPLALNGATVQGFYGPRGGEEVLFLGGSTSDPGTDAFSEPENFFCFYATSIERLGNRNTPITGYCHLNDGRLAVLKNDPDDSTVFFRNHQTVTLGMTLAGEPYTVDAYPSVTGAAVEGCVSPHSLGMVGSEPCFLAKNGIYSVRSVSNELTNLNETVRRSRTVDPLIASLPVESARSICWNGYYLLFFGKTVLLTDGQMSSGSYRFLKWVFAHEMSAVSQHQSALYLGGSEGGVYLLDGSATDAGEPISACWYLPLLEEGKGKRMLLRRLWAAVSGSGGTLSVLLAPDGGEPRKITVDLGDREDTRWVSLLQNPRLAETFSVGLDLSSSDALLWGYRIMYEKGGTIR